MSSPGLWLLAALRWVLFSAPAQAVALAVTALLDGLNPPPVPPGYPTRTSQR